MIGRSQLVLQYLDSKVNVTVTCVFCGKTQPTFSVDHKAWERYSTGASFVQDAFPELDASERELLISAVCPQCWDEIE